MKRAPVLVRWCARWSMSALIGATALACNRHSPTWDEPPDPSSGPVGGREVQKGASSASAPHVPAPDEPRLATARPVTAATERACRATRLTGDAKVREGDTTRPLADGDLLPQRALVELAEGAELTVQSTASTREMAIVGPARAEACPQGEEEIRLSFGKVKGFPGMGIRPGTDVFVATPLGVVRFNDAKISVEVAAPSAERLEVSLETGQATFVPVPALTGKPRAADAGVVQDVPMRGGAPFVVERAKGVPGRAQDMVAVCKSQSEVAELAARAVATVDRDASLGSLGDRAFAEVRARQRARALCGATRAQVNLEPAELGRALSQEIDQAERRWKSPKLTAVP